MGSAAIGHTATTQLSGLKILRSTSGVVAKGRETASAAEVPAPPAFPVTASPISKHLDSSAHSLDGSFAEIFSAVYRDVRQVRSIKGSNKFVDNDKPSSVIIPWSLMYCGDVSEITVRYPC